MTDTINTYADPGSDPAHEWGAGKPEWTIRVGDSTVTPASLRAHADHMERRSPGSITAEQLLQEAARLEAESAHDEEAERYAKVQNAAECAVFPGAWIPFDETGPNHRKTILAGVRAVLDQLAADGRLLPEGEERTVYDETTLLRVYDGLKDAGVSGKTAVNAVTQMQNQGILFRQSPVTPPAVSVPLELPTEPGSRIRASVKRWGSALEWAATDPYVDTFTLGGRCWEAENDSLVVGTWNREYITVLEVLPAVSVPDSGPDGTPEKPWETAAEVPAGVKYVSRDSHCYGGFAWINEAGKQRWLELGTGSSWPTLTVTDLEWADLAPFVRVDGDKR
ncbi:hypothetical protein [Prescottella agglutinans]|uniref:Uncharacterized protein n=1 Tax=Prescottella agglutinans TaxID=1644129 RepID=A0ABT6MF07_9NOCA|nr:hypothetical protein [Prescottella agglutinans]MDH6282897.1 hypothetical protein [Prescottella agglutinans]